jgi:hypothetical protein
MTSQFLAIRVRPVNRDIPAPATAACRTAGCRPNGPRTPMSPPITGCPPCAGMTLYQPEPPDVGL